MMLIIIIIIIIIIIMGWTVRGSNPGGGKIFRTRPDHPAFYTMGTGSLPRSKAAGAWR